MTTEIDYQAVLADLEARRAILDAAIAGVKQILGQLGDAAGGLAMPGPLPNAQNIPKDAFFGLSIVDAAKKYLAIIKRKQSAREIAAAIERGGITHSSKDFYQTVYSLLRRRARDEGDIVKLPDGDWGLTEWYPGMKSKRGKAAKAGEEEGSQTPGSDDASSSAP